MKAFNRITAFIASFILIAGVGSLFQNCGPSFTAYSDGVDTHSSGSIDDRPIEDDLIDNEETPTPDPEPTPEPISYELPTSVVPLVEASQLNWQFNDNSPDFQAAVRNLASQCSSRLSDFVATKAFSPIIYDEGLLPGDPKIEQMRPVKAAFEKVQEVAYCIYFANTPALRLSALAALIDYINEWNRVYVGDGNPINDRFFIKLFIATDLAMPKLSQTEITAIRSLAQRMDLKEITFMNSLNTNDNRRKNNWMTRHLMIRTLANITTKNASNIAALKTKINTDVNQQYTTPTGFTLSTCANLRSIGAYGSFDLQQRDAFLYHLSGIAELVPIMNLKADLFTPQTYQKILTALNITKNYVLDLKTHPEFRCTSVQYDKDKLVLNPSLGNNWNPNDQRVAYRYARLIWPEIIPWTGRFITNEYAPSFKVYFTGKGDFLNPPTP